MTEEFDEPKRVAINRVYTRKGDSGSTQLVGGQKVSKAHLRIESYGIVDELNAFVGQARMTLLTDSDQRLGALADDLLRVQHQLFNLGSILATLPEDVHPKQPRVRQSDAEWLEAKMDECNATLEPLRSFVLPGGTRLSCDLHVCRTICRRAERALVRLSHETDVDADSVRYLNRLSDAFFVWSRWVVSSVGADETLWEPNKGAS